MGKPKKKGAREHVCMAVIAQGTWNEKERQHIRQPLLKKHEIRTDEPYPFHLKLTLRDEKPAYSDCSLCGPIHEMFQGLIGSNDHLYYHGHHYIIPEDYKDGLKELPRLFLENLKIKKLYFLYLDSFSEVARNEITAWSVKELKEHVIPHRCTSQEFERSIEEGTFTSRTLYEIIKY